MKTFLQSLGAYGRIPIFIGNRSHCINLPDALLAHEGFFAAHFFTENARHEQR
jgi:hypothetical protein